MWLFRFFCGPHAKKSDALAKQQKKRPRSADRQPNEADESEWSEGDTSWDEPDSEAGLGKADAGSKRRRTDRDLSTTKPSKGAAKAEKIQTTKTKDRPKELKGLS